jgi:hypothetical protein
VSTRRGAVRAGRLRGERVLDLSVDHRLLDSAAEVLGLGELQPEGVGGHGAAFQGEHLTDFGRLVLAVEHDLHGDLHATLRRFSVSPARARLTARRSKRSRPSSGSRAASSSRRPAGVGEVLVEQRLEHRGRAEDRAEHEVRLGVLGERPGPAAARRRAGPPAAGAAPVDPAGLGGPDLFQPQVEPPAGGEVVVVDEPLGRPQTQVGEVDPVGVIAAADAAGVADAVLGPVDHEPVQVLTVPAEGDLQPGGHVGDAGVAGDEQPPPDQRAAPVQHDAQLEDARRSDRGGWHAVILATPAGSGRAAVNSRFTATSATLAAPATRVPGRAARPDSLMFTAN